MSLPLCLTRTVATLRSSTVTDIRACVERSLLTRRVKVVRSNDWRRVRFCPVTGLDDPTTLQRSVHFSAVVNFIFNCRKCAKIEPKIQNRVSVRCLPTIDIVSWMLCIPDHALNHCHTIRCGLDVRVLNPLQLPSQFRHCALLSAIF